MFHNAWRTEKEILEEELNKDIEDFTRALGGTVNSKEKLDSAVGHEL